MDNENTTPAPQSAPSTQEVKKESDNKSIIYIIISLLIVLVAAGAYFMGTRKTKPQVTPTPTPAVESPTPSESPIGSPTATPKATKTPTPTPIPSPTPTASPIADLIISDYTIDPIEPTSGQLVHITIKIKNQGNATAGGFWWEWKSTWALTPCRERIAGLDPAEEKTVSCTYTYGGCSNAYETKATADSDNEIPESNEGNNSQAKTIKVKCSP